MSFSSISPESTLTTRPLRRTRSAGASPRATESSLATSMAMAPSPRTRGEGWGEGSSRQRSRTVRKYAQTPHACPLLAYGERRASCTRCSTLRRRAVVFGLAAAGSEHVPHHLGDRLDVQPPAVVVRVAADDAAVDYLRAAVHAQVAGDVAVDVHTAAVFNGQISVDRAAHVELAALHDAHV